MSDYYQDFDPLNRIKLEVEGDWPGMRNRILNNLPTGTVADGAWGYVTPAANGILEVVTGTNELRYRTTTTGTGHYFLTEATPCATLTGVKIRGRLFVTDVGGVAGGAQARLEYLDSAGAVVSTTAYGAWSAGSAAIETPTGTTIPAGVSYVRMRVDVTDTSATTTLTSTSRIQIGSVALVIDNAIPAGALTFPMAPSWTNILAPAHDLSIVRQGLNVGTLTATIVGATYHPASSTTVRPGRRVRLVVLDPGTSKWEPVFTGAISNGKVDYDYSRPELGKRVRITLTATDAISAFANSPRSDGVATVDGLRSVLEGVGSAWAVNGSGSQTPYATTVSINENASALDQVAITRDSVRGAAWVDRKNILQAYDSGALPATVKATYTESAFSGVSVDYDTTRCINAVNVTSLEFDAGGKTVEVPYGPFVDQASIDTWGAYSATFKVHGIAPGSIATYAASILTANATPAVRINGIRLPVTLTAHLSVATPRALIDLYDLVQVTHTETGTQSMRVTGIRHTITTDGWLVDLEFEANGSVAAPQVTPPVQTGIPSGWQTPSFTGGWGNFGSGYQVPRYRKDDGWVTIEGLISGGVVGSGMFVLPAGYRPAATIGPLAVNSNNLHASLNIDNTGNVFLSSGGSSSWVNLTGIRFWAGA